MLEWIILESELYFCHLSLVGWCTLGEADRRKTRVCDGRSHWSDVRPSFPGVITLTCLPAAVARGGGLGVIGAGSGKNLDRLDEEVR